MFYLPSEILNESLTSTIKIQEAKDISYVLPYSSLSYWDIYDKRKIKPLENWCFNFLCFLVVYTPLKAVQWNVITRSSYCTQFMHGVQQASYLWSQQLWSLFQALLLAHRWNQILDAGHVGLKVSWYIGYSWIQLSRFIWDVNWRK